MSDYLQDWVRRISEEEMPIFKFTADSISRITAQDDTSSGELANVILQDASLTARILKLANSSFYNPSGVAINTISRAVVFIGFNLVRDLGLSLAIIDALLKNKSRSRVMEIMACSFHAAVQARSIAAAIGDESPEEVFIATLLHELGEMAFWCIAREEGEQLLVTMDEPGMTPEKAQQKILGFSFHQLTLGLTQNWHLGDLLNSAINRPNLKNPRIQSIIYATAISHHAIDGWHSDAVTKDIAKLAHYLNLDEKEARQRVMENAQQAVELAQTYGAGAAAKLIPSPDNNANDDDSEETVIINLYPEPDPIVQLNVLRDLSNLLETKPNLNLILELVLEGVYRGIGMDRALFALLTPERDQIRAKYAVGNGTESLSDKFIFPIDNNMPNIFARTLLEKHALWIKDASASEYQNHMTPHISNTIGTKSFYLAPIIVNQRAIGLFYSDRYSSRRPLDETAYEGFKHFNQQACMAIEHLAREL